MLCIDSVSEQQVQSPKTTGNLSNGLELSCMSTVIVSTLSDNEPNRRNKTIQKRKGTEKGSK